MALLAAFLREDEAINTRRMYRSGASVTFQGATEPNLNEDAGRGYH
jgi:hypothetical protein